MKKVFLAAMWSLALIPLAWAEPDAAVTTVSSIAVPEGSPWYATIIAAIFPILLGALTWLSGIVSKWVNRKLEEVRTSEYGKWYAIAFSLAGIAVRAAESNYGPDTNKGKDKKASAVKWLLERLIAIDPKIEKTPNLTALLEGLVDAAYNDAFKAVAPLASSPVVTPIR